MDRINNIWPDWTTEELLGTGSYGKVYKVKKEDFDSITYAAVKVVELPQNQSEIKNLQVSGMDKVSIRSFYEDMAQSLLGEVQVLESLSGNENIVEIHDYKILEKEDGIGWEIYIRMELLMSLSDYIIQNELTQKDVIQLGRGICKALSVCHERNILHRDVKIDNIFVDKFGNYKLGDFGIAKQMEKTMSAMSQKGTSAYVAPEVFRGEKYDNTVDLYSLGIVMYRLLNNGRFPFEPSAPKLVKFNEAEQANMKRLQGELFPRPQNAEEGLADIIMKACAYEPQERYSRAMEMFVDLERIEATTTDDVAVAGGQNFEDDKTVALFEPNVEEKEDNQPNNQKGSSNAGNIATQSDHAKQSGNAKKTGNTKQSGSTKKTGSTKQSGSTKKTGSTKQSGSTKKTGSTKRSGSTKKTGSTKQSSNTKKTNTGKKTADKKRDEEKELERMMKELEEENSPSEKSKIVAFFLALIGGYIGLSDLYLGRWGLFFLDVGMLVLVPTLPLMVVPVGLKYFFELVLILSGKKKDGEGRYLK